MPAVAVRRIAAEGGDIDLPTAARSNHRDHAEALPNGKRLAAAKNVAHLLGLGARRHVVIFRGNSQNLVAHAPAGP
jgi:hypothetical protein